MSAARQFDERVNALCLMELLQFIMTRAKSLIQNRVVQNRVCPDILDFRRPFLPIICHLSFDKWLSTKLQKDFCVSVGGHTKILCPKSGFQGRIMTLT